MNNSLAWRSPSNIALIKYWGKFGRQEPQNASISFTLDAAHSDTRLIYSPRSASDDKNKLSISFEFEGQQNITFAARVDKFLSSILDEMPFLRDYHLDISSHNSFPHSAGIASSASGLSALALCVADMARQIGFANWSEAEFRQKASYFSRLASGSACRSIYGGAAIWGETPHYADASNQYAVSFDAELAPIFKTYRNDILFVSKAEKKVSSTAGHELMNGNPFAQARYQQANDNLGVLLDHLRTGEVDAVGAIIEEEALTLHALMMSSRPSFVLLQPATILLIHKLRAWREDTKLPLYFSLDAGPNLHLLYPEAIGAQAKAFIAAELLPHCENQQFLADKVGAGATKIDI
jgi:diphosphomevalonate decarboxylase